MKVSIKFTNRRDIKILGFSRNYLFFFFLLTQSNAQSLTSVKKLFITNVTLVMVNIALSTIGILLHQCSSIQEHLWLFFYEKYITTIQKLCYNNVINIYLTNKSKNLSCTVINCVVTFLLNDAHITFKTKQLL